jgi:hypothetical protein
VALFQRVRNGLFSILAQPLHVTQHHYGLPSRPSHTLLREPSQLSRLLLRNPQGSQRHVSMPAIALQEALKSVSLSEVLEMLLERILTSLGSEVGTASPLSALIVEA